MNPSTSAIDVSSSAMDMSDSTTPEYSTTSSSQPFRFLDLPKELRLMVYERLPRATKHYPIVASRTRSTSCPHNASMILVKRAVSTTILLTCKQINSEADHLIQRSIRDFILTHTPKVIMNTEACHDSCASDQMASLECFVDAVERLSKAVRVSNRVSSSSNIMLITYTQTTESERKDWYSPIREQLDFLCITDSDMQSKFNNICTQTERQLAFRDNPHCVQLVNVLPKRSTAGYQMLFQENRLRPLFHMNLDLPLRAGFEVSMAGWIEVDSDHLALDKCVPTYMQSRYSASARHHYNIRDKKRVYEAMDKETWTRDWLV
ncbi:hypothetical protein P153DRAFT_118004 [Dothidotthia symphoricarpi CBS 119687]|uniref:F-box domain-containing protein n=1 Tax=Dothidotthia symphoricarpi CBS 119687 TaxID=1392245 RepID=A0A6A5ZZL1_9PLEO|nr:uncharacterized protein P153DRAFT_118004 [Dothidotthia symphoricarpi CBS 119687]KAF2125009.1 hypothetical protein P153DRAFT_118004 [Dothidotthia symphoricarpi CBS 119687]